MSIASLFQPHEWNDFPGNSLCYRRFILVDDSNVMADQDRRQLQDLLEAAESSVPNDAATPGTTTTESDDMDYEPATEEDGEDNDNQTFLERLLAEGDEDQESEYDEGPWHYSILNSYSVYLPLI